VEGARELEQSAHRAADSLGDLSSAHGSAGDYVAQVARGLAPVVSGRLAASIRAERAATEATVTAGGPTVPYAGPIHWGWAARNISAQPFLVDALSAAETSVVNIYGAEVQTTVATIHGK
jgi:hypothetical protein